MEDTHIRLATCERDIAAIGSLWAEYWTSLRLPAEFQGFAEGLRNLPGQYGPPRGLLLLAFIEEVAVGTIGLRPLSETACEAKRLYVRPQYRGRTLGRALLERAIQGARSLGYEVLYGDTLPSMVEARKLYEGLGFQEIEPYSVQPTPGAINLKLSLINTDNPR